MLRRQGLRLRPRARGGDRRASQTPCRAEQPDFDLYKWTRTLALRIAMRALFGLDPDGAQARAVDAAGLFEQALGFYATDRAAADTARAGHPVAPHRRRPRASSTVCSTPRSPAAGQRRAGEGRAQSAARRTRRAGRRTHRRPDPRRDDDAAVRRPRHDDLDGGVYVLRARPPPRGGGAAGSRAGRPPRRQTAHGRAADERRALRARAGAGGDPAHVPARLDRPAPLAGGI